MTEPLDTIRPEVLEAMDGLRKCVLRCEPSLDPGLATIRAELLRLAVRNAELEAKATRDHEWFNDLLTENKKAEAELAALKARIAEAPIGTVVLDERETQIISCDLPEGTRAALVIVEE